VELGADGRVARAQGVLATATPGRLRIPDVDGLLERLPPGTTGLRRDLARIAVEALGDYPYTSGSGLLDFADARGVGGVMRDGPRGPRGRVVRYSQDVPLPAEAPPGRRAPSGPSSPSSPPARRRCTSPRPSR